MWIEMSVTRSRAPVKRRAYDAAGRRAAAEQRRTAVLDAAWSQFSAHGYSGSTVEAIASAAGVSTATVYKVHGGKVGIVRALVARALEGDPTDVASAEARSDRMRRVAPDPKALVEGWGALLAEVSPIVSPIVLLLRDVTDADAAASALFAEIEADRLARMAANAAALDRRGGLRPGVTRATARDLMWTYTAPDLYDLLVRRRGWSVGRYARFVTDAMVAGLL
jgi:AcrR family transcriptional regulator